MKWPRQVVLVRHAESAYNILRESRAADPEYEEFKHLYEEDLNSPRTKELAHTMHKRYVLNVSDADTPITDRGTAMARTTGTMLKSKILLPDVVFVSPYFRTQETLRFIAEGWPELGEVRKVIDDRIREREHGLSLVYNDWRVLHVLHPEQRRLRELQGPYWYQYPQGESISQVRDRIRSFVSTLIREYSDRRVLVITHHLTILSIRGILERWGPEEFIHHDENDKPINCGVTIYQGEPSEGRDGRLKLSRYNKRLY